MCNLGTGPKLHILDNSKGRMGVLPLHVFWKILSATGRGREPASGHCRELYPAKTFSHKLCISDSTDRLLYCQYRYCKINNMQLNVSFSICVGNSEYSDSSRTNQRDDVQIGDCRVFACLRAKQDCPQSAYAPTKKEAGTKPASR